MNQVAATEPTVDRLVVCLVAAAIMLATMAAFSPVMRNGYVNYDDPEYVVINKHVLRGLTPQTVQWAFTTTTPMYWHPLPLLSLMTDISLFGAERPGVLHLESAAIHAFNAALLMVLLVRMTGSVWRSALVAALFGLHPQRVESVAWIAERKDVLWMLMALLTLHAYVSWVRRGGTAWYLLMLLLFALGIMSKPLIVTLPCLMLLLDYWPLRRWAAESPDGISRRAWGIGARLVVEKIPLFAMVLGLCVITYIAHVNVGAMEPLAHLDLGHRLANAMVSYIVHVRQMFWPNDLAVFYPHPERIPTWQWVMSTALVGGVSVMAIFMRRRWPHLFVGWFWYLGVLVPVIGIVQVGGQARADRYTYFPMIGVYIMLAWSIPRAWTAGLIGRTAVSSVAVAVLAVLAWRSSQEIGYWRDSGTLFSRALEVTENNALAHSNLGEHLLTSGRIDEAKLEFLKAQAIETDNEVALINLVVIRAQRGDVQGAVAQLREIIQVRPNLASAHYNLGQGLVLLNQRHEAELEFREAMRLRKDFYDAEVGLGRLLVLLGQFEEAAEQLQHALSISPQNGLVHGSLGTALVELKRYEESLAHLEEGLKLDPRNADLHMSLGRALLELGRAKDAATRFEKALQIRPGDAKSKQGLQSARQAMETTASDPPP